MLSGKVMFSCVEILQHGIIFHFPSMSPNIYQKIANSFKMYNINTKGMILKTEEEKIFKIINWIYIKIKLQFLKQFQISLS